MIMLTLAVALAAQWTGPRTLEYVGPGNYCGGGYQVRLSAGDRALVLPQGQAPQATRFVLTGREVNVMTGVKSEPGKLVAKRGSTSVIQQEASDGVTYLVSDDTPYGLRITSAAFHGYQRDRWFFDRADFREGADEGDCLAARSN